MLFTGPIAAGKTTIRKARFAHGYVLIDAADIFTSLSRDRHYPFPDAFEEPMCEIGQRVAARAIRERRNIITEINAGGTAVLLVEQNAQLALSVAHHGYVLETGKVVLDQPAAQLLQDENVRKFYLGLHEGSEPSTMSTLRQRRTERKWTL